MAKRKISRCIVCGRKLEKSDIGYRISKGRAIDGEWMETNVFGHAHMECFSRMIESPKIVIEELRRQAGVKKIKAA